MNSIAIDTLKRFTIHTFMTFKLAIFHVKLVFLGHSPITEQHIATFGGHSLWNLLPKETFKVSLPIFLEGF